MIHAHAAGGHAHDYTAGANGKMLSWALVLTNAWLIAKIITASVFNSLALILDVAHMMTDAAALVMALLAFRLGRKAADLKRTLSAISASRYWRRRSMLCSCC